MPCGIKFRSTEEETVLHLHKYRDLLNIKISLDGSCMVSPSLGPPVTITDQQLLPNDLTLPLKRHAFPSFALTKTHVWLMTFTLCPGEVDHDWPLLLSGNFPSSASNAHVPSHPSYIFLSAKLHIKLSAFPYLVSFILCIFLEDPYKGMGCFSP